MKKTSSRRWRSKQKSMTTEVRQPVEGDQPQPPGQQDRQAQDPAGAPCSEALQQHIAAAIQPVLDEFQQQLVRVVLEQLRAASTPAAHGPGSRPDASQQREEQSAHQDPQAAPAPATGAGEQAGDQAEEQDGKEDRSVGAA